MTVSIEFTGDPPTVKGPMSQETVHPAFVFVTCDECEKEGYVPDAAADTAALNHEDLVCAECGDDE